MKETVINNILFLGTFSMTQKRQVPGAIKNDEFETIQSELWINQ